MKCVTVYDRVRGCCVEVDTCADSVEGESESTVMLWFTPEQSKEIRKAMEEAEKLCR